MRQIVPVYVATRARTRGVHERLAPERERGPPFAHASKCVNGHSPFTHGWGLLHPFASCELTNRGLPPLRRCANRDSEFTPGLRTDNAFACETTAMSHARTVASCCQIPPAANAVWRRSAARVQL